MRPTREQRRQFIIEAVRLHDGGDGAALNFLAELWDRQALVIYWLNRSALGAVAFLVALVLFEIVRW